MYDYWIKLWGSLFENSFNYYYDYTYKMFNPEIHIGTDDDVVIMGDVTVVLPLNKKLAADRREEVKDAVIDALKTKYAKNKSMFQIESQQRRLL
jgi:hypothetical protein